MNLINGDLNSLKSNYFNIVCSSKQYFKKNIRQQVIELKIIITNRLLKKEVEIIIDMWNLAQYNLDEMLWKISPTFNIKDKSNEKHFNDFIIYLETYNFKDIKNFILIKDEEDIKRRWRESRLRVKLKNNKEEKTRKKI